MFEPLQNVYPSQGNPRDDLYIQRLKKLHRISKINGVISNEGALNSLAYRKRKTGRIMPKGDTQRLLDIEAIIKNDKNKEARFVLTRGVSSLEERQIEIVVNSQVNSQANSDCDDYHYQKANK